MALHRVHNYKNLPTEVTDWNEIVEPAKDAYWGARREGMDENAALLNAIDTVVAITYRTKR